MASQLYNFTRFRTDWGVLRGEDMEGLSRWVNSSDCSVWGRSITVEIECVAFCDAYFFIVRPEMSEMARSSCLVHDEPLPRMA